MNKYYFDEEKRILYKSDVPGNLMEFVAQNVMWDNPKQKTTFSDLREISEEEADDVIKEIAGVEYDIIDGYVLKDFSGEV